MKARDRFSLEVVGLHTNISKDLLQWKREIGLVGGSRLSSEEVSLVTYCALHWQPETCRKTARTYTHARTHTHTHTLTRTHTYRCTNPPKYTHARTHKHTHKHTTLTRVRASSVYIGCAISLREDQDALQAIACMCLGVVVSWTKRGQYVASGNCIPWILRQFLSHLCPLTCASHLCPLTCALWLSFTCALREDQDALQSIPCMCLGVVVSWTKRGQ